MSDNETTEREIHRLLARYSDAVNHRDWETVRDCWAANGVWDLHEPINVYKEGVDAIMTEVQSAVGSMAFFVQTNHNSVVTVSGDTATARTTLNEMGRATDGKSGMFILAFYTDEIVRENGAWRFARRTYDVAYIDRAAPAGDAFAV